MKTTERLYVKLCETMDEEVKKRVVLPVEMYDAAIIFLASVAMRAKDPATNFEKFVEITTARVATAMRGTDSLIASRHN